MPTRGQGSRYKIPGPGGSEGGPGPDNFPYVYVFLCSFIICLLYKLTLSAQAKITLQLRVSLSDLVQILLTGPPLLRCQKKCFSSGPELALGAPFSPQQCWNDSLREGREVRQEELSGRLGHCLLDPNQWNFLQFFA